MKSLGPHMELPTLLMLEEHPLLMFEEDPRIQVFIRHKRAPGITIDLPASKLDRHKASLT